MVNLKNTLSLIIFTLSAIGMMCNRNDLNNIVYFGFHLIMASIFLVSSNKEV